jgi:hypothetical protein
MNDLRQKNLGTQHVGRIVEYTFVAFGLAVAALVVLYQL